MFKKFLKSKIGAELIEIIFGVILAIGSLSVAVVYIDDTIQNHTDTELSSQEMFEKYGVYDGFYQGDQETLEVKKDGTFTYMQITKNGYRLIINMENNTAKLEYLNNDGTVKNTKTGVFNDYTKEKQKDGSYRYKLRYTLDGNSKANTDYFDFEGDNLCGVTQGGCS